MTATSLIKYIGSKCRMSKDLQSIFDEHPHTCFVDVFGGSGAITINKRPSKVEVINDINRNLYTLYKVIRDKALCEELIEQLELTLWGRSEWEYSKHICSSVDSSVSEIERARCVFFLYNASFSGNGTSFCFERQKNGALKAMRSKITDLMRFHERLKNVIIECSDFEKIISRYDSPTTLFYLDPPYLNRRGNIYENEMGRSEHQRLLRLLSNCEGTWIISGYDHEMYHSIEKLGDVQKETFSTTTGANPQGNGKQNRTECVWIRPFQKASTEQTI